MNTTKVDEIKCVVVHSSVLAEYFTIPQWTVDNCGTTNNHHNYLKNVAIRNGMEFLNTVGGGSCFFDAVRQCLLPYGMDRTIPQLRMAAALELEIHADDFRPLYALEDHGQGEQATTYEEFIRRTKYEMEWATAMTVAALARSLDVCIAVIATNTKPNGEVTAYQVNNTDGVVARDKVIFVGYDSQAAHYVGFRSPHFKHFASS